MLAERKPGSSLHAACSGGTVITVQAYLDISTTSLVDKLFMMELRLPNQLLLYLPR